MNSFERACFWPPLVPDGNSFPIATPFVSRLLASLSATCMFAPPHCERSCFCKANSESRKDTTLKALISLWHAAGICVWCEKEKECVTAEFGDGFLAKNQICWRCLQKAVKVRSQQGQPKKAGSTENTEDQQPQSDQRNARRDAS